MKKHQEKYTEIENLKNNFIDIALLVGTILGFVAFIPSLLNAFEIGFTINYLSDLIIILIFFIIYIFRKKIQLNLKSIFILIGLFLFIITDFMKLGIFSDNKVLIIALLFLAFLVFSLKQSICLFILITISFIILAYLHINGTLGKDIDQAERAVSIDVWIVNYLLITIISFAIILILREFNKRFLKLIEDLKEKNKEIIEKESNYTEIFNATSNAIFIHDMSGKILEVNETMLKMYKFTKEEISSLSVEDFSSGIAPYNAEYAGKMIREAIEKGEKVFEWHAKDKEGKFFWVELTLKKTKIGGEDRVLAVVKDIDEQKRTALELEDYKNKLELKVKDRTEELEVINEKLIKLNESIVYQKNIIEEKEKRLNSIIQNQGEGFSINDLNEKFILATPGAHEIFGVSPGELIGSDLREFFDDLEWEKILKQSKLRKKGIRSTYEIKISLKDGLQKYLIVTSTPDYDESGNIIGTVTNFRDITTRIQKEKKLKELNEELELSNEELNEANEELLNLYESIQHQKNIIEEKEKRLNTIIHNQGEGLGIADLNENFIFASPSAHQIFGVPTGKLNGRNLKEFTEEDEWNKILEQTKHRKENKKTTYEVKITLKDGSQKHLIVTGSPDYDETGKIIGTIANFRDITERILKEQKLKELNEEIETSNEELNEANEELSSQKDELQITLDTLRKTQKQLVQSEKMASLGVLAAGMAHEINNPLNYIMGGITGLEKVCKVYFDTHKKNVDPLVNAIKEGVDRTANIITGLNYFSKHGDSYIDNCDIHTVIENCLSILQNKLSFRIEIIKNYQDSSIIIKGNEGKLHQLFLNLLSNAEQSIKDKGTISITSSIIDKYAFISVEDTGSGIKDEDLSKVTDPFFTTKDPGKGTGLGLSVVHQVIEEHRGSIEFKSKLGKGTGVFIKIPLQ